MHEYGLFIDGDWRAAAEGRKFPVTDPATGETVGQVADASPQDVTAAIDAAARAFPAWSALVAKERSRILRRWYDLIMEHADELARLMTREQGKPLPEARGEVEYAADFVLWYSEEAKRIYGETIPASHPHKRLLVVRQPVGVVAAITPWNFPAAMVTRKVAPALAAGCTVIIKPAEQTPLTACRLAELAAEAGISAGVLNIITTSRPADIAGVLMADERVRKITFTGSTEVGKILMRQAADTVKRVSLELGGHAPFLIFDDADVDAAVREVVASKFRNAGQTCVCANRIYVQRGIADRFVEVLAEHVRALRVGNGLEPGVQIGPLIDGQALDKVERHVADAVSKGAKVVAGGRRWQSESCPAAAHFFEPTVLTDVRDDMLVMQEETFGPVAPVRVFETEDEAIRLANNTRYGLAAYLFTRDLSRATRVMERLEYGIVGVNDGLPSVAQAPFGGFKESGLGREGGKYGLEEFLETKYVSIGLI